jgi:hypothetical protein
MKAMDGVQVRTDVIDEIMSSDKSAHLLPPRKESDKLDALNSMSGRELAREMGRLEATVKMPEAKRATDRSRSVVPPERRRRTIQPGS